MKDRKYWIGFNLIKGIGAVRMQGLIAYFGDVEAAWKADSATLAEAGLGAKVIERVLAARSTVNIDQPLPVLYIHGDYLQDDLFAVAFVGTRKVTAYGRQVTEEIASFLAANGMTVISGLARRAESGWAHDWHPRLRGG